ncbi:glycosyltransferase family 4 protein [Pseudoxanthomonas sacheonensis]|uniref:Glycosyltransferase involved in cell wall biosynthesis n=1 Tax=Pseudoxanthomonas sacheonensis TaxID=443615 RepID=A0ABU1RX17_9GAMM|nr:glycosyltransferase family 4 protein [Pseudoxanthomonas sacheonensis]MDR6843316.1 glycosyltransferase involved in cell wall biosynthesis [Pseudoxanthomonas sacheonensis]
MKSSNIKRVLFITRKYPPSVGGMETYSKCLFDAFNQANAEVDLHKPAHDHLGRPTLRQITAFFFSTCWLLLMKARRYDAILLGDYAIASLGLVAKMATFGRVRTVVSLHGNDLYFMRKQSMLANVYRLISRVIVASRCLDAAIANSHAIREEALLHAISPVFVVPLATQLQNIQPSDGQARNLQLLFTGRLIRYKGLSWFIREVWPHLDQRYELLVAGQIWDEAEHAVLRGQPRVRYLGTVAYENLPALRSSVMACIMPNIPPAPTEQDEGFGLVALEAPAVGTPMVASRCGGIPDAIADGITGFLLPPLDAHAWINQLNSIACWSEAERQSFAIGARKHLAENYNWQLVATRTLAVLRDEPRQPECILAP